MKRSWVEIAALVEARFNSTEVFLSISRLWLESIEPVASGDKIRTLHTSDHISRELVYRCAIIQKFVEFNQSFRNC